MSSSTGWFLHLSHFFLFYSGQLGYLHKRGGLTGLLFRSSCSKQGRLAAPRCVSSERGRLKKRIFRAAGQNTLYLPIRLLNCKLNGQSGKTEYEILQIWLAKQQGKMISNGGRLCLAFHGAGNFPFNLANNMSVEFDAFGDGFNIFQPTCGVQGVLPYWWVL